MSFFIQNLRREKNKKDLFHFLKEKYKDNIVQLGIINEFERDYQPEKAMWWYTRNCCLYYVLNEALRNYNFDTLSVIYTNNFQTNIARKVFLFNVSFVGKVSVARN